MDAVCFIVINRHLTLPAGTHRVGVGGPEHSRDFEHYCELVPGAVRVHDSDEEEHTFVIGNDRKRTTITLPQGSYDPITVRDFVVAWQTSESRVEAAGKLGMKVSQATRYSNWLWATGANLKRLD